MDDLGHQGQGRVSAELVVLDEDLKRAEAVAVRIASPLGVEARRALPLREREYLVGRDIDDLGIGVDEHADEPRAGDPVGLGVFAGDPFHRADRPPVTSRAGCPASGFSNRGDGSFSSMNSCGTGSVWAIGKGFADTPAGGMSSRHSRRCLWPALRLSARRMRRGRSGSDGRASSRTVIDLVTLSQHTGERMARFRSPIGRTIACAARPGGGGRACHVAAFRPPSCGCTWEGAGATLYRSEVADGSYVLGGQVIAMRRSLAIILTGGLLLLGPLALAGGASAATTIAPTTTCGNGVGNGSGQGLICEVTIVNQITASGGSATVTVRECHGAAGAPTAACTTKTTTLTKPVTSVNQCNDAINGGGGTLRCSVKVTNNFVGLKTGTTAATVNQCVGSGGGITTGCDPFPATTTGATITQCNGSANGGTLVGLTCTATGTESAARIVTINQCNGSANGGGALVICSANVTTSAAAASPSPSPSASP